jgi:hypothetical protein
LANLVSKALITLVVAILTLIGFCLAICVSFR